MSLSDKVFPGRGVTALAPRDVSMIVESALRNASSRYGSRPFDDVSARYVGTQDGSVVVEIEGAPSSSSSMNFSPEDFFGLNNTYNINLDIGGRPYSLRVISLGSRAIAYLSLKPYEGNIISNAVSKVVSAVIFVAALAIPTAIVGALFFNYLNSQHNATEGKKTKKVQTATFIIRESAAERNAAEAERHRYNIIQRENFMKCARETVDKFGFFAENNKELDKLVRTRCGDTP